MNPQDRILLRTAIAIHSRLAAAPPAKSDVALPMEAWERSNLLWRQLRRASQRDWRMSASRLRADLARSLDRLQSEVRELQHQLSHAEPPRAVASLRDLLADLSELRREFEDVSCDRRGRTVAVTTDAIELEGIYLGPFEIRLDWSDLVDGRLHSYRVIALDPHPAAANDRVTHPHVEDEDLCEGDGRVPIRRALQEGRLCDFFMIVANLLRTYNASSPYVSLDNWRGVECSDCGGTCCDDDRWTCEKCEATVCSDCYFRCRGCDGVFCHECVTSCEECDEKYCDGCGRHCTVCRHEFCNSCLDNQQRCSNCHEARTITDDEETEPPANEGQDQDASDPDTPL